MRRRFYITLIGLIWLTGCALDWEGHPLAVAEVSPRSVCEGDDFATPIYLSAEDSMATARLPGTPASGDRCITEIQWDVEGSEFHVTSGELQCQIECGPEPVDCPLEIALPGNSTATVVLQVRDDEGATDHASVSIHITSDCPDGAAP